MQCIAGGGGHVRNAVQWRGVRGFGIVRRTRRGAFRIVRLHGSQFVGSAVFERQCDRGLVGAARRRFDDRPGRHALAGDHRFVLCGHARAENVFAERMNHFRCALVGVDGNRHGHVRTVAQIRVVKRTQLPLTHVLRVLIA